MQDTSATASLANLNLGKLGIELPIEGMTCASCVGRVEKALRKLPEVTSAEVNLATEMAAVRFVGRAEEVIPKPVAAVGKAGYQARQAWNRSSPGSLNGGRWPWRRPVSVITNALTLRRWRGSAA